MDRTCGHYRVVRCRRTEAVANHPLGNETGTRQTGTGDETGTGALFWPPRAPPRNSHKTKPRDNLSHPHLPLRVSAPRCLRAALRRATSRHISLQNLQNEPVCQLVSSSPPPRCPRCPPCPPCLSG